MESDISNRNRGNELLCECFLSEAVKCYYSEAFWVKMSALAVALIYTFAVRNPLLRRDPPLNRWIAKLLGVLSIGVWMMVAAAGRWIGFS